MSRAQGDRGLDGFLNVRKPPGPTSHDQVSAVRRLFGTRRVGHAGTLDPLASGVLPVALGRATRLIDRLSSDRKRYRADVQLGIRTASDDLEGEVITEAPVPWLSEADVRGALAGFLGRSQQRPPAFSAAKVGGRRSYALARRGTLLDLEPRTIEIYCVDLIAWQSPRLVFEVECSKGTYVRSLARDLGERLGTAGSLAGLCRLRVGRFELPDTVALDDLAQLPGDQRLAHVLPPDVVLLDLPALVLDEAALEHFRHGRPWGDTATDGQARAYDRQGMFVGLAVADAASGAWRPKLSFLD
ncbi:MAG: tRNA pseudouridine(55) synthase TruB [Chloroflexi bacterium]|nr:tRNA pseudouridine(55) synthase TruB [Chloroflexota bacterium]